MEEKFEEIVSELFEISEDEIENDLKADDVLLWDSLNHMKMITALEDAYNIKLTMSEINSMDSFYKIKEIIKKHL